MNIEEEIEPMVIIWTAMSGAPDVIRAFVAVMEKMGRGDQLRETLHAIERERLAERTRLMNELGKPDSSQN